MSEFFFYFYLRSVLASFFLHLVLLFPYGVGHGDLISSHRDRVSYSFSVEIRTDPFTFNLVFPFLPLDLAKFIIAPSCLEGVEDENRFGFFWPVLCFCCELRLGLCSDQFSPFSGPLFLFYYPEWISRLPYVPDFSPTMVGEKSFISR